MPTWEIQPLAASEEPLQLWMAGHSHSSSVTYIPAKSDASCLLNMPYTSPLVSLYMDHPTLSQPGQHQTPARCAPLLCSLPWVSPSQAELSATSFFIYKMSTSVLLWHFYIACWFCVCWSLSPYFELLEKGPSLTHLLHLQHSAWYKTTGIH